MSTNYAHRPYPPYHSSSENYGPWFDDYAPSQSGYANVAPQNSASFGKRTLLTAAVAAVGAGAVVGLVAFNLNDASPDPAVSTVMIPGYGEYPVAPEAAQAPNAAVPPANSSRGPVIVNVPPSVRSGGQVNAPVPEPVPAPAQPQIPLPVGSPLPVPNIPVPCVPFVNC
jgi:hypothetical protein